MILLLSACQGANPAGPTAIPSDTATLAASLTPAGSNTPEPSLVPIVTATGLGPTSAPTIAAPTPVPTQGPRCLSAGKGDTLYTIAYKAGYNDPNILPLIRQLNNMCPGCNDIQVGQKICVPLPTATPTPAGYDLTLAAQTKELPIIVNQAGAPAAIATYVVVSGDTLTVLEFSLHASLRQLCALNNPDPINCAGCNLDAPLG
ncbi:MAG TPA: LysM peptidoglycan-binding domain-containing protein, partial [Aggregatilineales bacterium]|nr:LysM peptidoglycan-binding domain-containing protein [Aggregatilineales bacterium]